MNKIDTVLNPTHHIYGLFGALCGNPNLLIDTEVHLNEKDFVSSFHKVIFFAISNLIAENGTVNKITEFDIDTYLKQSDNYFAIWNNGNGIKYIRDARTVANNDLFFDYYHTVKKQSILRKYANEGIDISDIFDINTTDPTILEQQQKDLISYSENDLIDYFTKKILNIREDLKESVDDGVKHFQIGDGIDELIERLSKAPDYGFPFRNPYFNTLFNGKRKGKFFLQSGSSGGGKTRQSLMELVFTACTEVISSKTGKWVKNENPRPCLFISTELEKEELQTQIVSFITKLNPKFVNDCVYTSKGNERIKKALKIMKESPLYLIEMEEFDTNDIRSEIERHILNYHVEYINFDYIQMNPKLSSSMQKQFGHKMQDDQMLLEVSRVLKNIAKEFDVFISSSTQLNASQSESNPEVSRTQNALRGSKAIADKVDYGVIIAPPTNHDLKKINNIDTPIRPNMSYWVYKNRNNLKNVVIWSRLDLGTMKEEFLFATNYQYEPIDLDVTEIDIRGDGSFDIPNKIEV